MQRNPHTTDAQGFDYMANFGREDQDRDHCGTLIALALVLALTALQYCGLY
jgi:hypothetical protein